MTGIVEHRDADDAQREITEINSGIYVFDAAMLRAALAEHRTANDQGELYLTDVLTVVRQAGKPVGALLIDDLWQTEGVNDRIQLSQMNAEAQPADPAALDGRWSDRRGSGDDLGARLS